MCTIHDDFFQILDASCCWERLFEIIDALIPFAKLIYALKSFNLDLPSTHSPFASMGDKGREGCLKNYKMSTDNRENFPSTFSKNQLHPYPVVKIGIKYWIQHSVYKNSEVHLEKFEVSLKSFELFWKTLNLISKTYIFKLQWENFLNELRELRAGHYQIPHFIWFLYWNECYQRWLKWNRIRSENEALFGSIITFLAWLY